MSGVTCAQNDDFRTQKLHVTLHLGHSSATIKNLAIRLSMKLGFHHVYTCSDASNGDIGTIVDIGMHDGGRAFASLMYCVDSTEARGSSMTQGEDKALLSKLTIEYIAERRIWSLPSAWYEQLVLMGYMR